MYKLIISTEQYAGNFHREMVAFAFGITGACGTGDVLAQVFHEQVKSKKMASAISENVSYTADDHNSTIEPVKGWFNDGNGKHYRDDEYLEIKNRYPAYLGVGVWLHEKLTAKQSEIVKSRILLFAEQSHLTVTGIVLVKVVTLNKIVSVLL